MTITHICGVRALNCNPSAVYSAINTCDVSTDYSKSLSISIGIHKEERDGEPMKGPGSQSAFRSATKIRDLKVKGEFVGKRKKHQHGSYPKDTTVYLQRDRAR